MTAEILSIGTELLLGNIANTDAQIISQGLSELGINVYFHTVVGDNPARIKQAVEIARNRSDIIITTGGLGPTYDDITKEALAECFGKRLVRDDSSLERIGEYFAQIGAEISESNARQAMLPEGCVVLDNDWGTAPGCAFEADGKHVIMLPGPPRECEPMFKERAVPYLRKLSDSVLVSRNIRIFGMGESAVEDILHEYMQSQVNPTVAPYAKEGEVMIRVTAKAENERDAYAMTEPVVDKVAEMLGDVVYGVDIESLEEAVMLLLKERGLTLASAESCTGGLLSARMTELPGVSAVFVGGVCAYSNDVKINNLSVPEEVINQYGAVSEQVVYSMAENVRKKLGADIGISISGVAGPAASESKPVGTVCIGVSSHMGTEAYTFKLRGNRSRIRTASVNRALDLVRRHLLDGGTN
ncbi:MAG: competence/damage-inducible protein A [Clostridiales bacterium]|nr:competence/damage-inducible protein A [Clostridiales bacterium]